MSAPDQVIAVVGPTGVGKSAVAQSLGIALGGEIISADSMQIYRGMDIGTAKVRPNERLIPHHGIDIVDLGTPYSAAEYQRYARSVIDDCRDRSVVPIVCGGTGLYVAAALDCMDFPSGEQKDNPLRARYEDLCAQQGEQHVWDLLSEKDPESAALIHPNNVRRVIRALEMWHEGISYAAQKNRFKKRSGYLPTTYIGLTLDRALLYERIDKRVLSMIDEGLVDEVTRLIDQGFEEALTAIQAIGYKELVDVVNGTGSLETAISSIQQSSRRYAKRQLTWFRSDDRIRWIDVNGMSLDEIAQAALDMV